MVWLLGTSLHPISGRSFPQSCHLNEICFLQLLDHNSHGFAISNWNVLPLDIGTTCSLKRHLIKEVPPNFMTSSTFITCYSLTIFYFPLCRTYLLHIKYSTYIFIACLSHFLFTTYRTVHSP